MVSRLRQIRESKVMSQRDLGKEARVSPATIVRLEKGASARFVTIKKLATALGVPPESLIERDAGAGSG